MAAKKKEVLTLCADDLGIEEGTLKIEDNKIIQENLCLPPERKRGIILEGSEEEISGNLVRLLREEEKII
jgi:electron transfer flavoprotein alpha/beta subunit